MHSVPNCKISRKVPHVHHRHAVRIDIRQWTTQHAVSHAKHCGIGADSQRQRRQRNHRKSGVPPKSAETVAKILQKIFQHLTRPDLSDFFFGLLKASQLDARRPLRFRGAHARPSLLLSQLVQISAQLLIEIMFDAGPREEIAAKTSQTAQ